MTPRFFNTAGPCRPDKHYMLSATERLGDLLPLIAQESYFVVHAPRQSGKSTAMLALAAELTASGKYAALLATCEAGAPFGSEPGKAARLVVANICAHAELYLAPSLRPAPPLPAWAEGDALRAMLQAWALACPLPVVLFLDEIDALRDDALLSVLRQLRAGYNNRPRAFPQCLALIGLRDVRDYRVAAGGSSHLGTASPFNIKVASLTLRNFTQEEVARLYGQHTADTGQRFADGAVARAFDLTRGQPWLVNALAREATEKGVPDRAVAVTVADIDMAKERLIASRATHLDSLADKLREPRVRRVLEPILAGGEGDPTLPPDDIDYCLDLGLVVRDPGQALAVANPIYREVIPRELTSVAADFMPIPQRRWTLDDGRLDLDGLVAAFVDFWREHGDHMARHQPYAEAAPQLVLMAFLQRVVNGGGQIEREYGVGSGRIDLLIRWPLPPAPGASERAPRAEDRHAIELKVWRPGKPDPLAKGLEQLDGYLARLGLPQGVLVLFDRRPEAETAPWEERPRWEDARTAAGRGVRVLRL